MLDEVVQRAVRRVLIALNLRPDGFEIERGFVQRALLRGAPRVLILSGVQNQMVFVGRQAGEVDAIVQEVSQKALHALPERARAVCAGLVVAWLNDADQAFAAVFAIGETGEIARCRAQSWRPPEEWAPPLVDIEDPPAESLDRALDRVVATISGRYAHPEGFEGRLDRALHVVDVALRLLDGEVQDRSVLPSSAADDQAWSIWFSYYESSVLDEWKRAGGQTDRRPAQPVPSTGDGPLRGLRVFLSYARPDATRLAWPIHQALTSAGATVWFDQRETVDADTLAAGFADVIAGCDAYILCATTEFFERSGYATQELAWALQRQNSGGRLVRCIVVTAPGTVLPTLVADWPKLELVNGPRHFRQGADQLQDLVRLLTEPVHGPVVPHRLSGPSALREFPLSARANVKACRRRGRHVERFLSISTEDVIKLLEERNGEHRVAEIARNLAMVGDGLGWPGTFQGIGRWPADSLIRDMRFRMSADRVLVFVVRPLGVDDELRRRLPSDVEYLATRRVPVLDWPAMTGWDDDARNFALRHHVGRLRQLREILRRGLYTGLTSVSSRTLAAWESQLAKRVCECHDMVLDLRLTGRLSWRAQSPQWDWGFRQWQDFVTTRQAWQPAPPPDAIAALVGCRLDLASVGADVTWTSLRSGKPTTQSFAGDGRVVSEIRVGIAVHGLGGLRTPPRRPGTVHVELSYPSPSEPTICIAWNLASASPSEGSSVAPATTFALPRL
jgi:hypothetical protein